MKCSEFVFLLFALSAITQPQLQTQPLVKTGVDVLIDQDFSPLKGKRVGLITNPTGVTGGLESTIDIFARSKEFTLAALFAPEHGIRGEAPAGGAIASTTDFATGVAIYSLYGRTKKPTAEMLKGIDVLVYDIQDIGIRSYTFISTMAKAMEAAAENNIEFVVLDRPDPLTGERVEGNVIEPKFKSFVGMFPIPYVYGMTCGEIATMINDEGWLGEGKKCKLTVIRMQGWKRSMTWEETGLRWVPPSPHIPTPAAALFCAATGILGELNTLSVGVGYTLPFQLVGAPWINGSLLSEKMNALELPGIYFRPVTYTPFYAAMKGKQVNGVELYLTDPKNANLVNTQLYLMETINAMYPAKDIFAGAESSSVEMFDKVMGTDQVRRELAAGIPAANIIARWQKEVETFMPLRKKYLLYE
ncbi:MAG TPA: DUF1343 domain-containing protein [Bacteroidota bacterium]|nr:DUF1343 domain-containing protein [Bacteroidota bacterium]